MNIAIILAGGIGSRMRTNGMPKQYIEVLNKPILVYTLEKFQKNEDIDRIIIVAHAEYHDCINEWLKQYGITKFYGFAYQGESRQESILNGLHVAVVDGVLSIDKVIIHDSVRPLVSQNLISHCLKEIDEHDGCMPVISVNDTIYQSQDGKKISTLLDRSTLYAGQSPEAFNLEKYYKVNVGTERKVLNEIKGSSEIAFSNGFDISLIPGEVSNFKLTTPEDLARFEVILRNSENESI